MKCPTKVYADGSHSPGEDKAGWGAVILHRNGYSSDWAGPVVTDRNDNLFLGAEKYSNNTAELSAIACASKLFTKIEQVDGVEDMPDSTYALNIANGIGGPKSNVNIAGKTRESVRELASITKKKPRFRHTPSHIGHVWNERVDKLAGIGANHRFVSKKVDECGADWMTTRDNLDPVRKRTLARRANNAHAPPRPNNPRPPKRRRVQAGNVDRGWMNDMGMNMDENGYLIAQ